MTVDVSTSFKKLQAERNAADAVIRELTPLEGTKDVVALRDYFSNVSAKDEVRISPVLSYHGSSKQARQDDLQRLSGKLTREQSSGRHSCSAY